MKHINQFLFVLLFFSGILFAQSYNNNIPKFGEISGYKISDKPASYFDVVKYITEIAGLSDRVEIVKEGKTFQGRDLYYLIVTSPKNHTNMQTIKKNLELLSDPRIKRSIPEQELIENTPAVVFMMYSIHGNEASGTNASLKLTYELAANNDESTMNILDSLIVIIYPMENPDGRQRFINQAEQWYGSVVDPDIQSYPHTGLWPSGRTNHYHFDLNRDWFILSQPESKARVKAILEWKPQLVVDAHEMGSLSTFLFNPPRAPINPNLQQIIIDWWNVFAKDQAAAFDEHGWSYYTREWLEEWYPGYGSSWPSYLGAVAILYEQARTAGTTVKRPDGTSLTYGQSVEHQYVSSLANIKTALKNRRKLLRQYIETKREAIDNNNKLKAFIIKPNKNDSRLNKFLSKLKFQNIELFYAGDAFSADAKNPWGEKESDFPKGSIVIPLNQPLAPLVRSICEFDTRMTDSFLKSERESILKGKGTRLYEVSAWSMPLAYGLDVYESTELPKVELRKIEDLKSIKGAVHNLNSKYGYVIPIADDNVFPMLNELLDAGIQVNVADKDFTVRNMAFIKGTLLIRKVENPNLNAELLQTLAEKYGITIYGVNTALAAKGADLGGGYFTLLNKPQTALLVGRNVSMNSFGSLWYLFDHELNMRVSKLEIQYLNRFDLSKYNVIILPSYFGSLKNDLSKSGLNNLTAWIKSGGTFITMGRGAKAFADTTVKLSRVKLRSQILTKLNVYKKELKTEREAFSVTIDSLSVWEPKDFELSGSDKSKPDIKALTGFEKNARKFSPRGVILSINLNTEHWLTYGMQDKAAAFFSSPNVFMSKNPVETPVRFADFEELRLSGLLWPEARKRIANSAYLTRERFGSGQIILFAEHPDFRAYFYGTYRLLLNAVFFGPGHGTRRKIDW